MLRSGAAAPPPHMRFMSDAQPQKACPICSKPAVERYRPFCSRRCADVDLHRWLSGAYAVPVAEEEQEDERSDQADEPEN